jgi:mevalonate kinase
MSLVLSVPSKTYLTGEYAVLVGGSALVLNTGPRFELRALRKAAVSGSRPQALGSQARSVVIGEGVVAGIPEGAPAIGWLKQREPLLRGWQLDFIDPHAGRGGFGASGAQFVLVHAFTTLLQMGLESAMIGVAQATSNTVEIVHSATKIETNALDAVIAKIDTAIMLLDPKDVWNDYQVFSKQGSGADLLAQMEGHVSIVSMEKCEASSQGWPYKDIGFMIARTGQKIPTHEHLAGLKNDHLQALREPASEAVASFGRDSGAEFARKVKSYSYALREMGFQSPHTLELIAPIEKQDWCLAAKGCGAFGADTLLVLFAEHAREDVLEFLRARKLELVATNGEAAKTGDTGQRPVGVDKIDARVYRSGSENGEAVSQGESEANNPLAALETGLKVTYAH